MKGWDAIVVGAGIIGLSVALELRKRGMLKIDRITIVRKVDGRRLCGELFFGAAL